MQREITVIGAGFSGLMTAYFLVKAGLPVRVLERSARVGGLLGTQRTPHGLVEKAANGLLNSALLESVCADLGVTLQAPLRQSRARFIWREGQPRRWPLSMGESARLGWGLLRHAGHWRPAAGETIAAWGERVLGRAAVPQLLTPALGGIYASEAECLSASLILARRAAARKPKLRGTVSFAGGMQMLLDALHDYLLRHGVRVELNQTAQLTASAPTVLCTSATQVAELLREVAPAVSEALAGIEMLPLVTATCFYERSACQPQGFGCLFPRGAGFRALGVLFNDCIFAERSEMRSETWVFNGAALSLTDIQLKEILREDHARLVGNAEPLLSARVTRWPQALPHYSVALERTLADLPQLPAPIALVGNYLGQIGLTKILARAQAVAAKMKSLV